MADNKVVINLMTGHEDADKVTVAYLVATAAQTAGKDVIMFLTKEADRLGLPGYADAIESAGSPTVAKLSAQFTDGGGQYFVCPICFNARRLEEQALVANAKLAGATPLWEWIGVEFSGSKTANCSASDSDGLGRVMRSMNGIPSRMPQGASPR